MAGIREAKKKQTRAAIIEAAVKLFSSNGYEKTSINDLAREAGVGKGTIYSYFRTKSEVFLAFCEDQLEYITSEVAARQPATTTLLESLLAVYTTKFQFSTRYPEFGRLLMRETYFPSKLNVEQSLKIENKYITMLLPILQQAQESGELRKDLELTFVLGHFYGLYCMTISAWYTDRLLSEEDVAMALHGLFEQALQGLAPKK